MTIVLLCDFMGDDYLEKIANSLIKVVHSDFNSNSYKKYHPYK